MGDTVQLGQWGGYGGKPWEWTGSIRKIVVSHDKAVVYSLTFTYIKDGKSESSPKFGGEGGEGREEKTVSLSDDEYLVKMEGTVGVLSVYIPDQQVITSLTFVSNKKKHGPYGNIALTKFSLPLEESRIAGFFGRCGEYLDAIGVSVEGKVKVGLWGGPGEKSKQYDGPIKEITLKYGDVIESISFGSTKFGGDGGHKTKKVSITITGDEYLISIRGTIRNIPGKPRVISSLVFLSNKRSYGPFPNDRKEPGKHFCCPVLSGKITGFYGRYGNQINAIGIIMAPLPPTLPIALPHKLGGEVLVVGGQGGQPFQWDGPTHKITVKYSDNVVHSITFDGNNLSKKIGGEGGRSSKAIPNKVSDEYVVEVRGTIGFYKDYPTPVVKSLKFVTNRQSYGPHESESGNQFSYSVKNGYIWVSMAVTASTWMQSESMWFRLHFLPQSDHHLHLIKFHLHLKIYLRAL